MLLATPLLYVDAELEAPTVTAEVDGSSILFMAEDAKGYNRTVVELEGIGLWEAVTPEEEEYIDLFIVPAPTLETVRWRAASAIAPEDAGGRYRIGPWTDLDRPAGAAGDPAGRRRGQVRTQMSRGSPRRELSGLS